MGESVAARSTQLLESPRVGDACLVPIGLSLRSNKWTLAKLWSKGKVVEANKQKVSTNRRGRRHKRVRHFANDRPTFVKPKQKF